MPSYVERFLTYIERETQKLQGSIIKNALLEGRFNLTSSDDEVIDYITQMENVKKQLSTPVEEWPLLGGIFVQFDELSTMMTKASLKMHDKMEIVFYLIRKNLATDIATKECAGFDDRSVLNHRFKTLTKDEVDDILYDKKYKQYLKDYSDEEEDSLSEDELAKIQEFREVVDLYPIDISDIVAKHVLLKEHLMDKWPNIGKEDIEIVTSVFTSLGLHKEIVEAIRFNLMRQVAKIEKSKKESKTYQPKYVYKYREGLSDREYKRLNRALKPYFDLNSMVASHPLSLKEQIYCVKILMDMLLDDKTINEILNRINRLDSKTEHPIVRYLELYDKLNYYKGDEEIDALLVELEQAFQQMFIADSEDYEIIKCVISDDIGKVLTLIPQTYDYEKEQAKES